tara:strand:- start:348 stop:1769 length:1422 start_codon:yes stop_codon:yes gene_type:complete
MAILPPPNIIAQQAALDAPIARGIAASQAGAQRGIQSIIQTEQMKQKQDAAKESLDLRKQTQEISRGHLDLAIERHEDSKKAAGLKREKDQAKVEEKRGYDTVINTMNALQKIMDRAGIYSDEYRYVYAQISARKDFLTLAERHYPGGVVGALQAFKPPDETRGERTLRLEKEKMETARKVGDTDESKAYRKQLMEFEAAHQRYLAEQKRLTTEVHYFNAATGAMGKETGAEVDALIEQLGSNTIFPATKEHIKVVAEYSAASGVITDQVMEANYTPSRVGKQGTPLGTDLRAARSESGKNSGDSVWRAMEEKYFLLPGGTAIRPLMKDGKAVPGRFEEVNLRAQQRNKYIDLAPRMLKAAKSGTTEEKRKLIEEANVFILGTNGSDTAATDGQLFEANPSLGMPSIYHWKMQLHLKVLTESLTGKVSSEDEKKLKLLHQITTGLKGFVEKGMKSGPGFGFPGPGNSGNVLTP